MTSMQLGYSTWGMPDVPIETSLRHLSKLGFDAVEIGVLPRFKTALSRLDQAERQRIVGLLKETNLRLSAIMVYLDMMAQAAEAFDHNLAQVHSAIDLAAAWTRQGLSPVVISGIGGKPGQFETMQDQLVDRLNQLGQYAEAQGVVVALEHHIGAAIETPDQAVALMQQVESPAIRINFDISHFNVAGFSLEESISKVLPYAAHTHIKDERGRAPDHEYLIPGEGEFDYVAYLKMMQAHGYEGVISTEISMMVQTRPDYDPLATAAQSYQVLSRAFAEAGIER